MDYEVISIPENKASASKDIIKQLESTIGLPEGSGRHAARTVARGAESVLGLPGDVASAALGLGNYASGGSIPSYSEVQDKLPLSLPTSAQVRKGTQYLTGESLEPQSEGEAFYDEVVGDLASFLLPIKGKVPFKGALLKSLGGNAASWLAKNVGAGEGGQAAAKIGFNVLSAFPGGRRVLTQKMDDSLRSAQSLGVGARQTAKGLKDESNKILKWAESGAKALPEKKLVRSTAESLNDIVRNNSVGIDDALVFNNDLNTLLRDSKTPREAIPYLEKMSNAIGTVLTDFGKANKEFGKNFFTYQDLDKGINQASKVSQFIQDNVNIKNIATNPLSKILALGGIYLGGAGKVAGAAAATYGAREAAKAFDLLKNSAQARTYYKDLVRSSLRQDAAAATRALSKLDKEAIQYEGTSPQSEEYEVIRL